MGLKGGQRPGSSTSPSAMGFNSECDGWSLMVLSRWMIGLLFIYLLLNLFGRLLWLLGEERKQRFWYRRYCWWFGSSSGGDGKQADSEHGSRSSQQGFVLCGTWGGRKRRVKDGSWLFCPNSRVKGPFAETGISAREAGVGVSSAPLLVKLGVKDPGGD